MQTTSAPALGKGSIQSDGTHLWARCHNDPRTWIVIPVDPNRPTYRAVTDDFGQIVPVGGAA